MSYHIVYRNSVLGPMTEDQLFCYDINQDTQVSKDNGPWQPLYAYPELMAKLASKNAVVPPAYSSASSEISNKKLACGLLAIFLGGLGVQYFVLGKVKGGLLTILLSLVTCGLWSFLMLIQGILMLVMSDQEFYRKYMATTSSFPLF